MNKSASIFWFVLVTGLILSCFMIGVPAWEYQDNTVIYENYPGTLTPDYSKPRIYINKNRAYETVPGTTYVDPARPLLPTDPRLNQPWKGQGFDYGRGQGYDY